MKNFSSKIKIIPTKFLLFSTLIFFVFVFFIYYKESVSFRFIDEYNNFLAGYFLLKGKALYSEIFFQHQPLIAYLSYLIQKLLNPDSLYKLVLYHRLIVIFSSFLFSLLLVYRFRFVGLSFVIIFELTKYFIFGNTFLAESFVVYPIIYLFGLVWEVLNKKKIIDWELILSGILTYAVIFSREPYVITALVLYGVLLLSKNSTKSKFVSIVIFAFLSLVTLITLPIKEYFFQLTTVNIVGVISPEISNSNILGLGFFSIFFYPLNILFNGINSYFRGILIIVDLVFIVTFSYLIIVQKKWKIGLFLILIMGISNIRVTEPGTSFYSAYHMIVWYGLFLFITLSLAKNVLLSRVNQNFKKVILFLLISLIIYIFLPNNSLIWHKNNRHEAFNNNFGQFYSMGNLVKTLSNNNSTFFIDGWDSLSYWQADIPVSYPYLFYYEPMKNFKLYTDIRANMFKNYPPTFVYSDCKLENDKLLTNTFNEYSSGNYEVFYFGNTPICLYIRKDVIKNISKEKWDEIKKSEFYLKSNLK